MAAVAAGGVLGAEARYGLAAALPHTARTWPWATLVTNTLGCLLIGVLMVVLLDVAAAPPKLARPFLGVGVLGGFTTFSTFALDTYSLIRTHRELAALSYLAASLVACLVAVTVAVAGSRRLLVRPR
ncbi:MAG: fluoride efflux transporter CrcB [Actinomycetota bacterium]|nr:fluoride efflux transporter CrcB [Actinomycetota bacterium]